MILRNPTNSTVSITLDGVHYDIAPQSASHSLPETVGARWLKVHSFLIEEGEANTAEETTEPVVEVKETPEPVAEAVEDTAEAFVAPEVTNIPEATPAKKETVVSKLARVIKGKK